MDHNKYERDCKRIRAANAKLLDGFEEWLAKKGISQKTIDRHVSNTDIYINVYLLYQDAQPAAKGVGEIGMFFGYWFIRKAMWASPTSMRSIAASLKKFYAYMVERGLVEQEDFDDLKWTIRDEMSAWLATLARWDEPDNSDPDDFWGF